MIFSGGVREMEPRETKIFDPADGFPPVTDLAEITDATVAKRGDQWWMYAAGQVAGRMETELFSASLAPGQPLATTGWRLTTRPGSGESIALLASHAPGVTWDLQGGRHCPAYVKGWDPENRKWVERIYYAGAAENLWGPYAIGFLEWDGKQWAEQGEPVFVAKENWEHGSVYEPNLIYADGKWKMWYVAGSNQEDYLVHGFSESEDGRSEWSERQIFAGAEEKMFDFCVMKTAEGYEAVYSKVWLGKTPAPAETGLWWCRAEAAESQLSRWSKAVQILTAEDRGWHSGPWKPSLQYEENDAGRMFVFFDGIYRTAEAGPFPYAFTMGCLERGRPGR